jgi:hypothetical protein
MGQFNRELLEEFLAAVKPLLTDEQFDRLIATIVWRIMNETYPQEG